MKPTSALLFVLAACGGGGHTPDGGDGGTDPHQLVASVPVTANHDLDLLFVIDDSASMADKQNNLAVNFPNFINTLNSVEGGLPNIHLGVVTTDMGTTATQSASPGPGIGTIGQGGCAANGKNGALQTNGAMVTGTFISDIKQTDGTRLKNYTGDLATTFAQMARVGATGCGFEQPLFAMRRALENNPSNAGFLRPNALLGVVFLTDEDDCTARTTEIFAPDSTTIGPLTSFRCTRFGVTCSGGGATSDAMNTVGTKTGCTSNEQATLVEHVQPFHDFLVGLKSDPNMVVVGGIMGDPEPFAVETRTINQQSQTALAHSCQYQGVSGLEVADPGSRMKAFFDLFPNHATFSTVCQPDLSVALENLGILAGRLTGSACLTGEVADVDPGTPGTQLDCIVEDVVGANATRIPQCGSPETPPCWKVEVDAQHCTVLDHLKLVVSRSGAPDPSTVTTMRCIVP